MPAWVIVLIILVVAFIIWAIKVQNKLVSTDEFCENSLSGIGVQQNSRWDALNSLADLVKQYDEHEYQSLMDIIAKRQPISRNSTAAEVNNQENMLESAMSRFMAVSERYPELKADKLYGQTMDNVKEYEENVRLARMTYNDSVTKYNRIIRKFPSSFIAKRLSMKVRDYLETENDVKAMPNLKR